MTDTLTPKERSLHMARIKAKGNKSTEQKFLLFLRRAKITGWRRQFELPGKPDFYFPKLRMAIFLDGCFWHGCPMCYRRPKSNVEFWVRKVQQNRKRDRLVVKKLTQVPQFG